MLDPICIRAEWLGSTGQKWAGWFLHIGLLPGRICLSKIWHNQPELNQIWAGFAQYYPGCLWKTATESKWEKVAGWLCPARSQARWFLHTSLLPDQMRLAKPWPDHPDQIQVGFVQYNPCLLWKTEQKQMQEVGSGIYDAARLWLHAGHNSYNWPKPKCFWTGSGMFTGCMLKATKCICYGVIITILASVLKF